MQHFYGLLDFKKAFESAQEYHRYAIKNGDPQTKAAHLAHHIQGGNFDVLVQRLSNGNNKQKRAGR